MSSCLAELLRQERGMDEEQPGSGAGYRLRDRHPAGQYRTRAGTSRSF